MPRRVGASAPFSTAFVAVRMKEPAPFPTESNADSEFNCATVLQKKCLIDDAVFAPPIQPAYPGPQFHNLRRSYRKTCGVAVPELKDKEDERVENCRSESILIVNVLRGAGGQVALLPRCPVANASTHTGKKSF